MTGIGRVAATGLLVGLVLAAGARRGRAAEPSPRININTASAQELTRLPGIGPAKAEAILQHRAQHPFAGPMPGNRVSSCALAVLMLMRGLGSAARPLRAPAASTSPTRSPVAATLPIPVMLTSSGVRHGRRLVARTRGEIASVVPRRTCGRTGLRRWPAAAEAARDATRRHK